MNDYLDFGIIDNNLKEGVYQNSYHFNSDVQKVLSKIVRYYDTDQNLVNQIKYHIEMFMKELSALPLQGDESTYKAISQTVSRYN